MNKKDQLRLAILRFLGDQTQENLFDMMVVTMSVTKQGSGLLWSDVGAVVKEAYAIKAMETK